MRHSKVNICAKLAQNPPTLGKVMAETRILYLTTWGWDNSIDNGGRVMIH